MNNTYVEAGITTKRTYEDRIVSAAQCTHRSPVSDQIDRIEKAIIELQNVMGSHIERIDSCLHSANVVPERTNGLGNGGQIPAPNHDCDLSGRLARLADSIQEATALLSRVTGRVCL